MPNKKKLFSDEYIIQGEPESKYKAQNWRTAIGLQQVDGLVPSKYLIETANKNINGDIDLNEAKKRIIAYYDTISERNVDKNEREADNVSLAITEILAEQTFSFSVGEFLKIHKRLFKNVPEMKKYAGMIRDCNLSKKEWVLNGATVLYSHFADIKEDLEYDFEKERNFDYKNLSEKEIVSHITKFVTDIWQAHPFREGNTRAVAVFLIKYLRTFGFDVDNNLFEKNSWYFRNALVRANYWDYKNKIYKTTTFLDKFFQNLLFNSKHELKNRYLNITGSSEPVNEPVNSNEENVIMLIKENPNITRIEMSNKLNISLSTTKRIIKKLKECGKIEREGSDKTGKWCIKGGKC